MAPDTCLGCRKWASKMHGVQGGQPTRGASRQPERATGTPGEQVAGLESPEGSLGNVPSLWGWGLETVLEPDSPGLPAW